MSMNRLANVGAAQQGFEPGGAGNASPCCGLPCEWRLIAARFHFHWLASSSLVA